MTAGRHARRCVLAAVCFAAAALTTLMAPVHALATDTSIFGSSTPAAPDTADDNSIELGVKFSADSAGSVTGIRFYKSTANTGTHTGTLWTTGGSVLATGTFSGETSSGWQTLTFGSAVAITPGTTYVASYLAPAGHYAATSHGFDSAVDAAPLHALDDASAGGNGVYVYSFGSALPNSSYHATNYWVDVTFATDAVPTPTPTPTATATPTPSPTGTPSPTFDVMTAAETLSQAAVTDTALLASLVGFAFVTLCLIAFTVHRRR
jgi:hypothetical protein